jgi:hypothetical protein
MLSLYYLVVFAQTPVVTGKTRVRFIILNTPPNKNLPLEIWAKLTINSLTNRSRLLPE